jgi:hypothetical protein
MYKIPTMSRNTNTPMLKKYCKVCHDSGKPIEEYQSHFTRESRDPKSKVICPTLLALECRYCFNNGHTVKYCSLLNNKDKIQTKDVPMKKPFAKQVIMKKVTNKFSALETDSDEEDETFVDVKELFPKLSEKTNTISIPTANYAIALSKPAIKKTESVPAPWSTTISKVDWVAMDSDSEDDDEEEYNYKTPIYEYEDDSAW